MLVEILVVGSVVGLAGAFVAYVARSEMRLSRAMKARMAERGFASDDNAPPLRPTELRLEARFGWRGKLADGRAVRVFVGRGFGPALSPEANVTSTGHYFYTWALLPPAPASSDACD